MVSPPVPYFGGKRRVAGEVWARFGDVPSYSEPFMGMMGVALARPHTPRFETVNDKDGFIVNTYRAIRADPMEVASHLDWPVFESDLHARHGYLVGIKNELAARLEGDPMYYDAIAAGWWLWGACLWIGKAWCNGHMGNWIIEDGKLQKIGQPSSGIQRQRPHLRRGPFGVMAANGQERLDWLSRIQKRIYNMRLLCGDWRRAVTPAATYEAGAPCAIFLDPPYLEQAGTYKREKNLYASDDLMVAKEAAQWAIEHGEMPHYRIALCGLEGEHNMPDGWTTFHWKSGNIWGGSKPGKGNEVIHFSPHCLPIQHDLLGMNVGYGQAVQEVIHGKAQAQAQAQASKQVGDMDKMGTDRMDGPERGGEREGDQESDTAQDWQ